MNGEQEVAKVVPVLGMGIHATTYARAAEAVLHWAQRARGAYLCAANVHMVMEAWDSPEFRTIVNSADLVTPDGMPLVWMLRLKGVRDQQRVYGPTLMKRVLGMAETRGVPVGFLGGRPATLGRLLEWAASSYPRLQVAYAYSPPFSSRSNEPDHGVCMDIKASEARILFVGLGCPKQERWMADHRSCVNAAMLGVGAAFDFFAGEVRQAPSWMQRNGLEWLFRLLQEPKRLGRRYLYHNPRFLLLAVADLLAGRRGC